MPVGDSNTLVGKSLGKRTYRRYPETISGRLTKQVKLVALARRVVHLQARWHLQAQCLRSSAKEPATARYCQRVTSKGVSQVEINAGPDLNLRPFTENVGNENVRVRQPEEFARANLTA